MRNQTPEVLPPNPISESQIALPAPTPARLLMARPLKRLCTAFVALTIAFAPLRALAEDAQPAQNLALPDEVRDIRIDQNLGAQLPLDLTFEDERGQTVQLRQYFNQRRPVILQLGYYGCPMLCGLVSKGIVDAAKNLSLRGGTDYDVLYISIDPSETAKLAYLKKQSYIQELGKPAEASGWHFLVGKEENIRQVTEAVGWKYKWVESSREYAHPSGIVILSPDGKVSRYLNGVLFDPTTLRLSLVEAAQGKVGSAVDQLLLVCFQYDAGSGKYALAAISLMRGGGVLTVVILSAIIARLLRREFAQRRARLQSPTT